MIIQIDISGLEELYGKLDGFLQAVTDALRYAAYLIRSDVREYTGDSHGIKQGIVSEKQRGFIFALLRSGGIPYSRTGQLMWDWSVEQQSPLEFHINNPTKYGPYVIGEQQTMQHHSGGWKRYDDKEQEYAEIATDIVKQYVDAHFA